MSKRILILGANGFIGSCLFSRFSREKEYSVVGLTSQKCNLLSLSSAREALSQVKKDDTVIMAAAITRLKDNSLKAMLDNIQMTENTIQAIGNRPFSQFIYLSSVDVYGCLERKFTKHNQSISEDFELKPNDYYGIGKVTCEFLIKNHLEDLKVPLGILRLPGVFGPGDDAKSLIGQFFQSMFQESRICIWGDGTDRRDYIYLEDIFLTVRECIKNRLSDTINVVNGRNYSINEIAQMIKTVVQQPCHIQHKAKSQSEDERIKNMKFDPTRLLRKLPGFQLHGLEWGVENYWMYLSAKNSGKQKSHHHEYPVA